MGMYKSNISPETEKARSNNESVEAFLARGGQIKKVADSASGKKTRGGKKIDAQKLLDEAIATGDESVITAAITFLKSQGVEVQ